ncbi:MAG: DUF167 domain-containing protein [Planctomycetota bacterium]
MDTSGLRATETREGVRLHVRAQPGASRPAVKGLHAGALKIAVDAVADRGKANAAITEYLGKLFGLPRSRVRLLRGDKSREKLFLLEGLRLAELMERLRQWE